MLRNRNGLVALIMSLVMMVSLFVTPSFAAAVADGLEFTALEAEDEDLLGRSDVAFTVYTQYGKATRSVAKSYTKAELERLAETESVGYLQAKGDALKVKAAGSYIELDDLIADALPGDSTAWSQGSKLTVECTDGVYKKGIWAGGASYETLHQEYKWFPNLTASADDVTGAVDAPAILALTYDTADISEGTAEEARTRAIASAYDSGHPGILVGTTEAGLANKSETCAGNRFPSGVVSVTVTVPEEKIAFTLYKQEGTEERKVVRTFTKEELYLYASDNSEGYLQAKGDTFKVKAASKYISVESLLKGFVGEDYWKEGSKLFVGCSDMDPYTKGIWGNGASYATVTKDYRWFPSMTSEKAETAGSTAAPAILALSWDAADIGTGTGADAHAAALASSRDTGNYCIFIGTTEEDFLAGQGMAGARLPSNVNSLTVWVPETEKVLTVYKKTADGEKEVAASYTKEQLAELAEDNSCGYLQSKGGSYVVRAAAKYVELDRLISDALGSYQSYWANGAKLSVECSDGEYKKGIWKGGASYETLHQAYKWFPNVTAASDDLTGAEDAQTVLAISWGKENVGDGTAADARNKAIEASTDTGNMTILVGTTEDGMLNDKDNALAGNRWPSEVVALTVTMAETPQIYDITYELNGGTIKNQEAFVTVKKYEEYVILPAAEDMSRPGHTFRGWYRDAAFKDEYVNGIVLESDRGDVTCYAKWSVNSSGGGGSGSGSSTTAVVTPKAAVTPITVAADGSQMMGTSVISKPISKLTAEEKAILVENGSWTKNAYGRWALKNADGAQVRNCWALVSDAICSKPIGNATWYYFDANGFMVTGWVWITAADGKQYCYYFNEEDGSMYGGCLLGGTKDGYALDEKGRWVDETGALKTK